MTTVSSFNKQTTVPFVNTAFTSSTALPGITSVRDANLINFSDSQVNTATNSLSLQVTNNYGESPNPINSCSSNEQVVNGTCQITISQINPHLTVEPYRPEDSITLNYSDLGDLLINFNSLPTHIQGKVKAIADKQKAKPRDFLFDGYYPQTTLISLVDSNVSQSICRCGLKPGRLFSSPGLCHKPRLCLKCACLEARRTLNVFQPNCHHHDWGFLTVSFHGDLTYSMTESSAQWWRYWDAASHGVRNLRKAGYIQGAIVREELKINRIAPIRVLPHVHAIVSSPDINDAVKEELAFDVYSFLQNNGEDTPLFPSIDFKPLPSGDDFENVWHYIFKPTLFYDAYISRWNEATTSQDKENINSSMYDMISAAIHIPRNRRQTHYLGNMRSNPRSNFIGVTQAD